MKTKSYISDRKWHNSFWGKFIYIYRGSGELQLSKNTLIYSDKKREIEINKREMISVEIGQYSSFAKPLPLHYIDITYSSQQSESQRIFLTPTPLNKIAGFMPVWKTNIFVKKCMQEIEEWINS